MASETDNVSAGNNRESGNKRLGTGRSKYIKKKTSGGKMIRSAFLSLMDIL